MGWAAGPAGEDAAWDAIAVATGVTAERARAEYSAAVDGQARIGVDVTPYREVL